MSIDLHTHTTCSDGTYTPAGLIRLAHEKKLRVLAVTDHDTVAANEEAEAAGRELNIIVVPGVELSVDSNLPQNGHMHMVGLFIDYSNSDLTGQLEYLRRKRLERNEMIFEKLGSLGYPLHADDLNTTVENPSIGRPHIARAMVEKGYVKSVREAFARFLKKGAPAYLRKEKLPEQDAIRLIHHAGGIAILAHPVSLGYDSQEKLATKIRSLQNMDLDGIEVYSPMHDKKMRSILKDIATQCRMPISGGSDFHGVTKPGIDLGRGNIPFSIYAELVKYLNNKKA